MEAVGTIFSSIILSASSRTIHHFLPSGASEQANTIRWALNLPPNRISRGGVICCLHSMADLSPSSTKHFLSFSRLWVVTPKASATFETIAFWSYSPVSSRSSTLAYRNLGVLYEYLGFTAY